MVSGFYEEESESSRLSDPVKGFFPQRPYPQLLQGDRAVPWPYAADQ
jgi:hypothetical protein